MAGGLSEGRDATPVAFTSPRKVGTPKASSSVVRPIDRASWLNSDDHRPKAAGLSLVRTGGAIGRPTTATTCSNAAPSPVLGFRGVVVVVPTRRCHRPIGSPAVVGVADAAAGVAPAVAAQRRSSFPGMHGRLGAGTPRTLRPRPRKGVSPRTPGGCDRFTAITTAGWWCCPKELGPSSTCFTRYRSRCPSRPSDVAGRSRGRTSGTGTFKTVAAGYITRAAADHRSPFRPVLCVTTGATTVVISTRSLPGLVISPVSPPDLRRSSLVFTGSGAGSS